MTQVGTRKALLVGNPVMPRFCADEPPLDQLPGSEAEVESLDLLLTKQLSKPWQTIKLTGVDATKSKVQSGLSCSPPPCLLHIATHGSDTDFVKGGMFHPGSFSLAAPSPWTTGYPTRAQCSLYASELQHAPLGECLLANLSACRSGTGRSSSDGDIGLSRACIAAGCHAVIASLWSTSDKTSQRFCKVYYNAWLVEGKSQLASFRIAVLEVKKLQPNPGYWAPYQIITADLLR